MHYEYPEYMHMHSSTGQPEYRSRRYSIRLYQLLCIIRNYASLNAYTTVLTDWDKYVIGYPLGAG